MARVVPPVASHSTRNVAFELYGMRPFTVISPRASRSHASADDVTVAPGTRVAGGVLGLATHGTDRPARLHELARSRHEPDRLGAGDVEPGRGGFLALRRGPRLAAALAFRALVFLLDTLVGDHDDPAPVLIVADTQRADGPLRLDRLPQVEVGGWGLAGLGQSLEQAGQIIAEGVDLLLLGLQGDEHALLARLQVEDALAGRPHRARREVVGRLEVEGATHLIPSAPSSPFTEFTVSTAGPSRRYTMAVMEPVAMTIRWKRSRWVPRA